MSSDLWQMIAMTLNISVENRCAKSAYEQLGYWEEVAKYINVLD